MLFKDAVALLPYSSFHILSHRIVHDSTSNGSNSTGRQGNSNRTLKRFHFTLSMVKSDNNAIAVVKAVNALMKAINVIEGDVNCNQQVKRGNYARARSQACAHPSNS